MTSSALGDVAMLMIATGLLWKGADWVVLGASRLASRFGLSDVVIGMTVVALGTSAPEMVVTLEAAFGGEHDIAVANVVGSNIFNAGFILGGCAVIWGIPTTRTLVGRDAPALFIACVLLALFLSDNELSRWEGLGMVGFLSLYLLYLLHRDDAPEETDPADLHVDRLSWWHVPLLLLGLGFVIGGAHMLVTSAVSLARAVGLSEWAIGITIVAGGTSLPELACSISAGARGRLGMVAGNLIGSDLHNVLGVLGLAAFLHPLSIQPTSGSIVMMTAMVGLLVFLMRSGWRLSRVEGLLLIGIAVLRWSSDLAGLLTWG